MPYTLPLDPNIRKPRKIRHSNDEYEYHSCDCYYDLVHRDGTWYVTCESLNEPIKKGWQRSARTFAEAERMIYRDHYRNVRRWLQAPSS